MTTVVHPGDSLSGRQRLVYVIVLGALTALGPLTIDLYLPAFPQLQSDFRVSEGAVQLTLTGTTIGFGLGQLIVGPLSDRYGRRLPIIIATIIHILASVGVALSSDIMMLGLFRVLQGMGAAAGGVVAMAMVRDLFGGRPLVRMLSRLALVTALAPLLAPLIGSQMLLFTDWRGIFWALAAFGALLIVAVILWARETLPKERRGDSGHSTLKDRYRSVLTDRVFIGVAIIGGMTFSGLFSYLSASSFLFQTVYEMDAQQYGLLFAMNSIGIVVGTQTSARLTKYYGPQWIIAAATSLMLVSAVTIVVVDQLELGIVAVLIPLWFFIASVGFVFPCVQVLALDSHGHEAGTAASLLGAANFLLAGLISPIVGFIGVTSATPMAAVMICTSIVAVLALWFVVRPKTVPPLSR